MSAVTAALFKGYELEPASRTRPRWVASSRARPRTDLTHIHRVRYF